MTTTGSEPLTSAESSNELYELQRTLYTSKNPTRRSLHCARRDVVISAIEKWAPATHGPALEVGPGSGVYLPTLAKISTCVVASDIEDAYLRELVPLVRSYPQIRLARDDITESSFESAFFDLILCSEVIEHIADSRAALREMHRLLRPGGILILSTPQRYSPLEVLAKIAFLPGVIHLVRLIYGEPILETGHINLMTESQVRAQLAASGFETKSVYKLGLYIPILAEGFAETALRLERRIEPRLRGTRWDWLLWTQCYVARKRTLAE